MDNNEDNNMLSWTNASLQQETNNVLQRAGIQEPLLSNIRNKLMGYRVIMDWNELSLGAFIRGIDLSKSNMSLRTYGFVCDIELHPQVVVKCKTHTHRFYKVCLEHCLIFQKLSQQEQIILNAMDYVNS